MFLDASQIKIAGVYVSKDQALFVGADETLWGMGGGNIQGTGSKVWLRQLSKPATCTNYLKVYHAFRNRIILTQSGLLFMNGKASEIIDFIDNE